MSSITVTQLDFDRLEKLANRLRTRESSPTMAKALEDELDRAEILDPGKVPPDIVTIDSEALVRDLGTGEVEKLRVVLPAAAAPRKGSISVLAPLGLALLGARAGDEVTWSMPDGPRRLHVEQVTQQSGAPSRQPKD